MSNLKLMLFSIFLSLNITTTAVSPLMAQSETCPPTPPNYKAGDKVNDEYMQPKYLRDAARLGCLDYIKFSVAIDGIKRVSQRNLLWLPDELNSLNSSMGPFAKPITLSEEVKKDRSYVLDIAIVNQHADIVRYLLEQGADPNLPRINILVKRSDGTFGEASDLDIWEAAELIGNEEIIEIVEKYRKPWWMFW